MEAAIVSSSLCTCRGNICHDNIDIVRSGGNIHSRFSASASEFPENHEDIFHAYLAYSILQRHNNMLPVSKVLINRYFSIFLFIYYYLFFIRDWMLYFRHVSWLAALCTT